MDKINSSYGKWRRPLRYSNGIPNRWVNKWHQSEILGRPLRRIAQTEFTQRQNKREKEEKIGRCMRQITRDCRNLLKKKLEEVEAFNASIPENKFVNYNCFYCNQDGHITKSCPTKIKHDAVGITQDKFPVDKNMILCFRCREHGHFANKCPSKKQSQPTVSLKYPEFVHFKTRGIIKGTDKDSPSVSQGTTFKAVVQPDLTYLPEKSRKLECF
ncbi:ARID DNA-binding domain-containing protein [Tanacetum coccineum]